MTTAIGPQPPTAADLTLEEQLALTSGDGPWTMPALPRIGLEAMKMTDGSNGARGDAFHGTTAVCFPSGSAMGATWNVDLVYEVATALARECRRKNAHVLLGPTINLHRYPLGGRNFESYGEDPIHAGALARAAVRGLQDHGVAAVPKHFVANDSEIERESVDVRVDEATLRETYLVPFEMAVQDAGAWAIMSAYNRVNGVYCSANRPLLTGILKEEWSFDGVVISDWGGVDSAVGAANAGLDVEMPGPPDYFGKRLIPHLKTGAVPAEVVAEKADRVLRLATRVGALNPGEPLVAQDRAAVEKSVDDPADRALVRRAAAEAIVLLSNDGVLPLDRSALRRIAVIGPMAARTAIQGGGSSLVNPAHETDVLTGIRVAAGDSIDVEHAEGGSIARFAPVLTSVALTTPDGAPGALLEYFRNGQPVKSEVVNRTELTWIGSPLPDVPIGETSVRLTADLVVQRDGDYAFGIVGAGRAIASLDGDPVVDTRDAVGGGPHFFGRATAEVLAQRHLQGGRPYRLVVDLTSRSEKSSTAGVRLGMHAPEGEDPIAEAVQLAAEADVAVVVVGTGAEYEMEGGDRPDMVLPGPQGELVERVIAVNPRTVVLVNAGSAVDLTPAEGAAAELFVGYGGQEVGAAVADVLFGERDPGGRLPFSIPRSLNEGVPLGYEGEGGAGWAGSGGSLTYTDRGWIGYRHHEQIGDEARYPFGHGLSYGSASLESGRVRRSDGTVVVDVDLVNDGARDATAVVQCYARAEGSDEPRRLAGFVKRTVARGERSQVEVTLEPRAFRRWSSETGGWEPMRGRHVIDVAMSSANISSTMVVDLG